MQSNQNIIRRVCLDILILCCVGIPIFIYDDWGISYKRGFFCGDESLMYPLKSSTIPSWTLLISGVVLPVIVILIVEVVKCRHDQKLSNGMSNITRYVYMSCEIPNWIVQFYNKIATYFFGAAACELAVDIGKHTIGRLRPHFFELCQPVLKDGSKCADIKNHGKYITDFSCGNPLATGKMLKQLSLSFPSGHSSSIFFTMVFLTLYVQSRITWNGSKLLKHLLQFVFITTAWYTALSRLSDYKHHWSDVLAGSAIGSLFAFVVANFVSKLFDKNTSESYILPKFTKDMPVEMIKSNAN